MKSAGFFQRLQDLRYRYERSQSDIAWQDINLLSADEVSSQISHAINNSNELLLGKIGSNEQLLMLWASGIPINLPLGLKWWVSFAETLGCTTNAGVKPRSRESYLELYNHFVQTLNTTNILGLFKLPREKKLWQKFASSSLICNHLFLTPFFSEHPWTKSLARKRVFVVSPFLKLFQKQLEKRQLIWQNSEILPDFSLHGYEFPYLIDEECKLNWQIVYQDVVAKMHSSSFDVALFGCGALGFPLAHEAKRLGKVGIHLGGTLQLLFGVSGKRYEEHPYFSQYINEYWLKPSVVFRPTNYITVEGGCYW